MCKHTFYLPPERWAAPYTLEGQEARHLAKVLRLGPGEDVRLLDGQGREGLFRVERVAGRGVDLSPVSEILHPRPSSSAVMALAWSKATRRGFFMEKAVELGVHAVWLWQGEHSQGRLPPDVKESWHAQMIAGAKQCGNPWLPELEMLGGGADELAARSTSADYRILPWEQQEGVPMLTPDMAGRPGVTVYAIGPEGGFSLRELDVLRGAGFAAASLGNRVLRCETAALLCLGIHWWAAQQPSRS